MSMAVAYHNSSQRAKIQNQKYSGQDDRPGRMLDVIRTRLELDCKAATSSKDVLIRTIDWYARRQMKSLWMHLRIWENMHVIR